MLIEPCGPVSVIAPVAAKAARGGAESAERTMGAARALDEATGEIAEIAYDPRTGFESSAFSAPPRDHNARRPPGMA